MEDLTSRVVMPTTAPVETLTPAAAIVISLLPDDQQGHRQRSSGNTLGRIVARWVRPRRDNA